MKQELERVLNVKDLTMIVIGTVIGSGIFIVPATVLRQTDENILLALFVWIAAGVLSLLGALTYAELGALFPQAGGIYVYIREAFGRLPAFLYGWAMFFVMASGAVATLAVAFSSYLNQIVALDPFASKLVSVMMIVSVALVNIRGVRQSAQLQNWTTMLKVSAIVIISLLLLWEYKDRAFQFDSTFPVQLEWSLLSGIGAAMIGVLWAYEGWHYATFSAGEAKDPQRTIARALIVGTIVLIVVYLLANLAYLVALGTTDAARSDRIAATAVSRAFGSSSAIVITLVILVSMFSAANGITLTATRVYYAMAKDRVFFQALGSLHQVYKTPAIAVIGSSLCAALLAVTGTFEELFTYVVFAGWIFYALAAASVFIFRNKLPGMTRSFRVPGYPYTPLLFVLASLAIVLNTLITQPERGAVGLSIVLLGTPVYFLWKRF